MSTDTSLNLLTEPHITIAPGGATTLPGVLAALARDEIDHFPALRPHQAMFWHMFVVQLGALALHRAGRKDLPVSESDWTGLLRGLTPEFTDDAPWCLVVEDRSKPAFMQPPVPKGLDLSKPIPTPDALDLLITSKNHDLKQSVAHDGALEDWLFALITHQTGGTYSVQYCRTVRTGNPYAPRICMGLSPHSDHQSAKTSSTICERFKRDVHIILNTRERELDNFEGLYPAKNGVGLTWIPPWPLDRSLQLTELDIWFIEVCRRVRLKINNGSIMAASKSEKRPRIDDLGRKGRVGDPWTPESKRLDGRAFSLSDYGFHYENLTRVLFGERDKKGDYAHNWRLPPLLLPQTQDPVGETLILVAEGIAGQAQKTGTLGFHSRTLPISGKVAQALLLGPRRATLHELARDQTRAIAQFTSLLKRSLALAADGAVGESFEKVKQGRPLKGEAKTAIKAASIDFDRFADSIFFEHLWSRFDAEDKGAEVRQAARIAFLKALWARCKTIFEATLPAMPCPSLYRHRAEARARAVFYGSRALRKDFPEIFDKETNNAA